MPSSTSVLLPQSILRRKEMVRLFRLNASSSLRPNGKSTWRELQTSWKEFSTSILVTISSTWMMVSILGAQRNSLNMPSITSHTWIIQTWWFTRRRQMTASRRWLTSQRTGNTPRWISTFREWTQPLSLNCSMISHHAPVQTSSLSVRDILGQIRSSWLTKGLKFTES